MLSFLSIILLSISSMFSYGSKESCDFRDCDNSILEVEKSPNIKGAVTRIFDGQSDFYFMPITEYFSKIERVQYLGFYLEKRYTTYDENNDSTSYNAIPYYSVSQYGIDSYYHWNVEESTSYNLYLYDSYEQVILNPSFGISNTSLVSRIDLHYSTTPSFPNHFNKYEFVFTCTNNNVYRFDCIQIYNPLSNDGQNQYNPNLTDVEVPYLQYASYVNDELRPLAGLCFRNVTNDVDLNNAYANNYFRVTDYDIDIYNNGYDAGYEASSTNSYNNGYDDGFAQGQSTRDEQDYNAGYEAGLIDAGGTNPYMNSIFQGIFEVGLLPVNVFLTIFNFEVFGINISGLVSGLLTMSIIIIIVRFLFGGKKDD